MRRALLALAVLAGAVGLTLAVPLLGGALGVAQLVSFRAVVALAAVVVALVALGAGALTRSVRLVVPLVVVLVVAALAQIGVLAARAVPRSQVDADGPRLTVLSFNTLGTVRPDELARLVESTGADVVVLPETSEQTAVRTATLLADEGRTMQVHAAASRSAYVDGVALLVSPAVGDYPDATSLGMEHGALRARPSGTGPVLVAVHPVAPVAADAMGTWRRETREAADECAIPGAIVAGDLNATLDHPGLRHLRCTDAARAVGQAWHGTWPASTPGWLATPIDHVLVDGATWRVDDFRVLPATGGSDHRPVVAVLTHRQPHAGLGDQ
ncbi:endonuclease/exonuclease/phosphatase family protein [Cellulomonas sp. HZM]|uniref:endonuclease/exonuclease/phosphatase family protein n=1 Tax=Cellulomonas sp. HZM TaxID=1454010 RepID=UPI00068C6E83|nr:endonuclease/exonuclease/phosphatase family protein [Cellulomonas sp. HZM]